MYDILATMKQLNEGKGAKPDFLDIDRDGDRKESMKKAAADKKSGPTDEYGDPDDGSMFDPRSQSERESDSERHGDRHGRGREFAEDRTGDYSAKAARAGQIDELSVDALKRYRAAAAHDYGKTDDAADDQGIYTDADHRRLQKRRQGWAQAQSKLEKKGAGNLGKANEESEMEEGNDFTGARMAAIRAGKPTFRVDGKVYKVTGDTSDEKVMEREHKDKTEFDRWAEPGDTYKGAKGTITKTASGITHARRADDEDAGSDDDYDQWGNRKAGAKKSADGEKRGRGRPKGTKRSIGAKGPTGKSKLLSKGSIKEDDLDEDRDLEADAGEYGREGDMAKEQLHTIEAAAEELSSILSDEQDLPEWVQKKITLAKEYVDSARDYMLSQGDETMSEVAPPGAKAERMVKHIKAGYAKDGKLTDKEKSIAYATAWKAKKAGKVEETNKEEVEETTTAGSVATAPADAPKGKKGGMVFGKGVYESKLEESYKSRLEQMLTEGISINASQDENGGKSLSVTATDDDAVKLAQILQLAGMPQAEGYEEACPACGQSPCGCEQQVEENLANAPDEQYADTDTMVNTLSGGLNGRKSTGQTTIPVLNRDPARQGVRAVADELKEQTESRLWDLYKDYEK